MNSHNTVKGGYSGSFHDRTKEKKTELKVIKAPKFGNGNREKKLISPRRCVEANYEGSQRSDGDLYNGFVIQPPQGSN